MNTPLVSVVVAVYNGEKFIHSAIESILNQTYKNFEFLIIDDCSTDNTNQIIQTYLHDDRVKLITNTKNFERCYSRNLGIKIAKGKYIAIMDADDISKCDRLEKQVKFLEKNLDVDICSCAFKIFGKRNKIVYQPPTDEEIKVAMMFKSPLAHPCVMFRKMSIVKNNLFYDEEFKKCAEDYDLWERASKVLNFANLQEVLLEYRVDDLHKYTDIEKDATKKIKIRYIEKLVGLINADEINIHLNQFEITYENLIKEKLWFERIYFANREKKVFNEKILQKKLLKRWLKHCMKINTGFYQKFMLYISIQIRKDFAFYINVIKLLKKI